MNSNTFNKVTELEIALMDWAAQSRPALAEPPSASFLAKARLATRRAEAFRKMRQVAGRFGFKAYPLPDYLAELARAARVSLGLILPATPREGSPASPWIALARQIGLPSSLIELLARLWIAVRQAEYHATPLMARRSAKAGASEAAFLAVSDAKSLTSKLAAIEQHYPPETRQFLNKILAEIH